ncbi:WD40-repeat-containing domain protein [Russula emetica]|nr:WD40-repeat-containing domain protein [Russula emetica]
MQMRKDYIWDTARRIRQNLQKHENSTFLPMRKMQNHLRVNPSIALGLSPVTASFSMAGGAINKIIQKHGCIAISSATLGGQPNDPEAIAQPLDSYNRAGTLQIWKDGDSKNQSIILHGHCVIDPPRVGASEGLEQCRKCYTVNDISFDPNRSHLMASTGNNGAVQLWDEGEKLDNGCYEYPKAPHDVVYRERDSLMAVTCMNGCVYVHHTSSHHPLGDPMELRVGPPEAQHSVGAIVWGKQASADTLFASSESQSTTDYSGHHVAFDPDQGRCTYEFSAKESGDAMALDPDGARLALCTASHDAAHFLRLYDIRRKDGRRPLQKISLDTFFAGSGSSSAQLESRDGEVRAVSFSPDGLLLAISRSDDELHIYDSRFMGRSREPMKRFLHWGDDHCLGGDRWGIVDAVWVDRWCGRGLGVITGGSDGCVRFWDVRRSDDDISNGEVLARPDSDIGHFSVGDLYSGEKPLVVGDNGGRIYVYDHATAGSSTR